MNQRGFGMVVYLIAAAVLAAAFIGYGQYKFSQGVDKEKTRNLNAVLEKEVEMSALRRDHVSQIETITKKSTAVSEAANKKIRDLLQTNQALSDLWNIVIHPDLADFAWVQPTNNNSVRGRSNLAKANSGSSEAGKSDSR